MSAFLARLAARAVGQATVAQPRLPSLFEAASQDALEVIHDEVAVGPEAAATRSAAPASADSPAGDATSRALPSAATSRTAAEAARDPTTERTEPARSGGRQDGRRPRTVVADHAAPDERPGALVSDPVPVPPASLIVPAVPLAAATPVASLSADDAVRSASPSAPEPPPVQVHIGRLEIRANLPESAPARPPARQVREEAAKGVSLADYLRGAR